MNTGNRLVAPFYLYVKKYGRTCILLQVKIKRANESVSCVPLLYEHVTFQNWIVCLFDKFKMLS